MLIWRSIIRPIKGYKANINNYWSLQHIGRKLTRDTGEEVQIKCFYTSFPYSTGYNSIFEIFIIIYLITLTI